MFHRNLPILTFTLCVVGLAVAGQAGAACLDLSAIKSAAHAAQAAPAAAAESSGFTAALNRPDALRAAHWTAVDFRDRPDPSIVGLWKFQWSGGLPPDFGTIIWHEDGTEITLSAGRQPATGDVCMGVWKQVGRYTYTLNHIAMGYDGPPGGPPSSTFSTFVHLHMLVRLDPSGNSYTGHVQAVISAATPGSPFDESSVITTLNGNVAATRVEP
jgi:hypothetical protein